MQPKRRRHISPATIISIIALVFSLAGTGLAAMSALSKKQKKQVVRIADEEVAKLAPGLSVKSATTAGSADTANTANSANSATTAATADTAVTASNADKLGGLSLRGISQWVLFSSGGTEQSSGGVTATKLGAMNSGRYRVSFPSSVANCGLNANAGSFSLSDDNASFSPAMVMLSQSTTGPNDVQVQVTRDTGVNFDGPVWLTAQC